MITSDSEAWVRYPFHREWFNKLWVAERFNYVCGPNAVPVPKDDTYIVRPIYNLHGMGAGAKFGFIETHDVDAVPPGYFWCERFTGNQYSVELEWSDGQWNVISVFQGFQYNDQELFRFSKWIRVEVAIDIPHELNVLWDCGNINIEMIDGKIIEVHLRGSPDPVEYSEFVPVWSDSTAEFLDMHKVEYTFVPSKDYALGENVYRTGFYCR